MYTRHLRCNMVLSLGGEYFVFLSGCKDKDVVLEERKTPHPLRNFGLCKEIKMQMLLSLVKR